MKDLLRLGVVVVLLVVVAGGTFFAAPLWVNDEMIRFHLWRAHVRSEYVEVNGYKIHYFEALPSRAPGTVGGGKRLVLIHGLGSRGEDWSPLIPGLAAAGFHVYAPDLLGYGRSPKPDVDYSIQLEEETVLDFMQTLDLEPSDVGGWSMGGWVALKLTVDHPEMVDRLVVYDAAGVYFPPTFDASLFVPTDSTGLSRLSAMLTPQPKPLPGFVNRAAIRRLHDNGWVIERSVSSMESGKDLMDFKLNQIRQPTLVVWGKEDQLIPLAVGETMHRDIAGSSMLVVAGCGHLAPGECSKPVLSGTIQFLAAQPAIRGGEKTVAGKAQQRAGRGVASGGLG